MPLREVLIIQMGKVESSNQKVESRKQKLERRGQRGLVGRALGDRDGSKAPEDWRSTGRCARGGGSGVFVSKLVVRFMPRVKHKW